VYSKPSCIFLLLLSLALAIPAMAQMRPGSPPLRVDGTATNAEPDENQERAAADRAKKANLDRQAALKSDTDKLVKLADELKEYVDKSNENVLSLNVMKKADEIEKLAKSVKEKMKGPN
jgi:hypothetical protein